MESYRVFVFLLLIVLPAFYLAVMFNEDDGKVTFDAIIHAFSRASVWFSFVVNVIILSVFAFIMSECGTGIDPSTGEYGSP
jgi:hypothetical protein